MKLLQLGKSGINEFVGFNQKASYRKEQKCVVRINLVWIFFAIVFGVTVLKLKMFFALDWICFTFFVSITY